VRGGSDAGRAGVRPGRASATREETPRASAANDY
jgi:hypothetical protein